LGVDVWTDDDGHERLKPWAATDMVMINDRLQPCVDPFDRSRAMTTDQSARKWEVSAVGVVALVKELSSNTEQIAPAPVPTVKVELRDKIKVQIVQNPPPRARARAQSPSPPTEDQIQALMGDVSELTDTEKKLRRYVVMKYGDRWGDVLPAHAMEAAKHDPLYEKEVGVAGWGISTWRRALGRKDVRKK
jgi:hypothetical protein